MTAYTNITRTPADHEAAELDRMQEGCDLCGAHPVRTELDGDQMCQSCADKWVRELHVRILNEQIRREQAHA